MLHSVELLGQTLCHKLEGHSHEFGGDSLIIFIITFIIFVVEWPNTETLAVVSQLLDPISWGRGMKYTRDYESLCFQNHDKCCATYYSTEGESVLRSGMRDDGCRLGVPFRLRSTFSLECAIA